MENKHLPTYILNTKAIQLLKSIGTSYDIKRVLIFNSRLIAEVDHKLAHPMEAIISIDLQKSIGQFVQFDIPLKMLKDRTSGINKLQSTDFQLKDCSTLNEISASTGEQLFYKLAPMEEGGAESFFYEPTYTKNELTLPSLPLFKNATCLFNTLIPKQLVEAINATNRGFKKKLFWNLLIEKTSLKTLIAEQPNQVEVLMVNINKKITPPDATLILRTASIAASRMGQELSVKGLKTTCGEYWVISEYLYQGLKVQVFEKATMIKHVPYTRSDEEIMTHIKSNTKIGN